MKQPEYNHYLEPKLHGFAISALQFALHAFYSVTLRPRDLLHTVINNVDFFAISLCLVIGTAVSWGRRTRALARSPA